MRWPQESGDAGGPGLGVVIVKNSSEFPVIEVEVQIDFDRVAFGALQRDSLLPAGHNGVIAGGVCHFLGFGSIEESKEQVEPLLMTRSPFPDPGKRDDIGVSRAD